MRVRISNSIRVDDYTMKLWDWCQENLVVINPTYETLMKQGKEDIIRRTHVQKELKLFARSGNSLIIPFGCIYGIWEFIKNCDIVTDFAQVDDISIKGTNCPINLYDYQEDAVSAVIKAKGGVLVAGCGAGKTTCGIEIIHRIGKKALWLTHTKDLLKQAIKDMKNLYPNLDVGTITDGEVNIGKDVTVATVQTMDKIDRRLYENEFAVVVNDECHHACANPTNSKMFQRVLGNINARYKFGLTATPFRADSLTKTIYTNLGMSPSGDFQPTYVVERSRINTLTAEHVKFDLDTETSYDYLNADGSIIYSKLIEYLSKNDQRNQQITRNVIELNKEGRKQALLCSRVEHCDTLYNMLINEGLKVELITGKSAAKKREKILNETDNWDVVVSTISLFKEGINIKALDTVHLCSPAKDKSAVIQSCGRCERVMEGKKQPKFYDYVDVNFPYCLGAYKKRKSFLKNRG